MKLICDRKEVRLRMNPNGKNSMLVVGGSRMGKTYFVSNFAGGLIRGGNMVYLIDLGQKWSLQDKKQLLSAGAKICEIRNGGIVLVFATVEELLGCVRQIANAIGFQSMYAVDVLQAAFRKLASQGKIFTFQSVCLELKTSMDEDEEKKGWCGKVYDRLCSIGKLPDICFCLQDGAFSQSSIIWDLAGLDETYVQIATYLILYCLLCQQRRAFGDMEKKRVFAIIDEFQNLDCNRRGIIGTCLAEGQKYGLNLILITQFLDGNFSEAVIQQFKQGGFRVYFRLTEEEAKSVSEQLAYEAPVRKEISGKLARLPRGQCLMIGLHSLEGKKRILEGFRFLEVKGVMDEPVRANQMGKAEVNPKTEKRISEPQNPISGTGRIVKHACKKSCRPETVQIMEDKRRNKQFQEG